jgi:hypothetical protein
MLYPCDYSHHSYQQISEFRLCHGHKIANYIKRSLFRAVAGQKMQEKPGTSDEESESTRL